MANKVLQATLDAARAEIALAQIDTGKAEALRLAAEKSADDLARRLEREEMERRTLQEQTDAVRAKLSAAEAHAAELQAKFDELEMKRQADLDAARAEIALARISHGACSSVSFRGARRLGPAGGNAVTVFGIERARGQAAKGRVG